MRRAAAALLLAALVLGAAGLRLRLSRGLPSYDPDDDTGFFHVESAYQYRYARMAAEGRSIPELDRDAQWPEGVRTRGELTLWMEYATGWTRRLLPLWPDLPFRDFVLGWVAVVSSLSLVALYFAALALCGSPALSLAAAAAYGLSWAGFSNTLGSYEFEAFALPLIHASFACFLWALKPGPRRPALAAAAGAFMALALGSWHLTRFYLAGFLAACWLAALRAPEEERRALRAALGPVLLFCAAAGALAGSLREARFLLSPATALGASLWLWLGPAKRRGAAAAGSAAALALVLLLGHESSPYGHAWGLLWSKLAFGLTKPADPTRLSQDARLLWLGPFNSPEAGLLVFTLFPLALVLLTRLLAGKEPRPKPASAGRLTDALLALHAVGALFVARLLPAFAFFLCASSACVPGEGKRRRRLLLLVALIAGLEAAKSWSPASPFNPFMALSAAVAEPERRPTFARENATNLLNWLKENAGPDRPVLANFLSASILAYSGSPILLQPKFEAAGIRAKTADYLRALYSTEEDLHAFCHRHGAALVVYETEFLLDETKDGPRYASGVKTLRKDTAAVLMHFFPENLRLFRLVYENPDYRVFALDPGLPDAARGKLDPVYEWDRFTPRESPDGSVVLDSPTVVALISAASQGVLRARLLTALGRGAEALDAYEEAFALWPPKDAVRREAAALRDSLAGPPGP